jgi:hypothetical protein
MTALQVSKGQWFANLLFWVIVLGAKGAFDYFAIIKPLKLPMRALWNRGFLRSGRRRFAFDVPRVGQTGISGAHRLRFDCPQHATMI